MSGSILHLFGWDKKFVVPFRDLVQRGFGDARHRFLVHGPVNESEVPRASDICVFPNLVTRSWKVGRLFAQADKIIVHGLYNRHLLYVLSAQPWVLAKCYWVIWGGDLYAHETAPRDWRWRKNEFFRRAVIRRMGHFVTFIRGDYELARRWYGAAGRLHECLLYPSNLYEPPAVAPGDEAGLNVLVGNSADPSNCHVEILERLSRQSMRDVRVYCPLSYGDPVHAARVVEKGRQLLGEAFVPLTEFMSLEDYRRLLGRIHVAVFAHKRQQAMGNTLTLLGNGARVFMRNDVTPRQFFDEIGVRVFDLDRLELGALDAPTRQANRTRIREYCCAENLHRQWKAIFDA